MVWKLHEKRVENFITACNSHLTYIAYVIFIHFYTFLIASTYVIFILKGQLWLKFHGDFNCKIRIIQY